MRKKSSELVLLRFQTFEHSSSAQALDSRNHPVKEESSGATTMGLLECSIQLRILSSKDSDDRPICTRKICYIASRQKSRKALPAEAMNGFGRKFGLIASTPGRLVRISYKQGVVLSHHESYPSSPASWPIQNNDLLTNALPYICASIS